METEQILLLAALFILTVLWIKARNTPKAKRARLRRKVKRGGFTYWEKFEEQWIVDEKSRVGNKYNDFPGCYVILIFEKPVRGKRFWGWENIYVGQSVNVCQRVHNHFNGKGKGDVYADIKYGKYAYVRIIPVKAKRLNDMETALIEAFSATSSYNKTKGGAKRI
ncbi:MAG: GIY-YIG nuclease family protein [Oscillospiraceae bacterium]|nr:GIY-YIG nuclease family protein [Oscillospiraceae bacterium]